MPHANKFAFRDNFVSKVYGDDWHQLVAKAPLKESTVIKANIKKYGSGGFRGIAFGLLTQSKKNELCSGLIGNNQH